MVCSITFMEGFAEAPLMANISKHFTLATTRTLVLKTIQALIFLFHFLHVHLSGRVDFYLWIFRRENVYFLRAVCHCYVTDTFD